MFLLGDVGQQLDIQEVRDYLSRAIEEINQGEKVDRQQNRELERLQRSNQELRLYLLSLGRLLVKKGVVTEDELRTVVTAVEETSEKAS